MSNTKLLFGTYNTNDIDFITGTTYAGMTSKFKINSNGQLNIGTTPTTGATTDMVLLRDSSGNIKQISYPAGGGVTSFNSRTGAITPTSGDYTLAQCTDDSTHRIVSDSEKSIWNAKQDALSNANSTTSGILTSTDWNTFNSKLSSVPAQSFSSLTGKPTTLSGYGITDAYSNTNPSGFVDASYVNSRGFLTTVSIGNITSALGYTPANNSRQINSHALTADIDLTADDITDGTTYKSYSATDKAKVATIDQSVSTAEKATWNGKQSALGYTPVNQTTTINGHALSSDVTVTNADLGAVPTTRTINGHALSSNVTVTASDVSAVPTTRTINGYDLSANRTLSLSDVGLNFTPYKFIATSATAVIGTVSETIVATATIPAGTFNASDIMKVLFGYSKTASTGAVIFKVKINTTNSLSGAATILSLSTATNAGVAILERNFSLNGGNLVGYNFASSLAIDLGVNNGAANYSTSYNTANPLYVFFTIIPSNVADSIIPTICNITN